LEWRNKTALASALIYLTAVIFICLHAFSFIPVDTWIALYWIVLIFTILNTIGRSFSTESGNAHLLHFHLIKPTVLIIAKLIYNGCISLFLALVAFALFTLFLGNELTSYANFLLTLLLGSTALGFVFTFTAAISARAHGNLVLMSLLSLPVVLPLLILLVTLSERCFATYTLVQNGLYFGAVLLLNIVVIMLSLVLFPYLWHD